MALYGIDISHHNYTQVKTGILDITAPDFVIMKASEGRTYRDPKRGYFESRIDRPRQGVGYYHYARPENNDPEEEADNFLGLVSDYAGRALFALDVEGNALSLSSKYLSEWVISWCRIVKRAAGVLPLVYTGTEGLQKIGADILAEDIGLWYPRYRSKIDKKMYAPYPFCAIWQFSENPWDQNKFFGSRKQWDKYCEVKP